jgi:Family of unknown function (DUF5691)
VSNWQAVLSAALIGAERAVVPPPPGAPVPSPDPASADPAGALLDHAALLTVARRAGQFAGAAEPPRPAAADPRPVVSAAGGRRLRRILGGENADLLHEWLTAVVTRGLRPPPQYLPALLDRARRVAASNPDPDEARLRGLVAAAGGPRAMWLAGLNPAWSWLTADHDPSGQPPASSGPQAAPAARLSGAEAAMALEMIGAQPDITAVAQLMAQVPGPWPAALTARVLSVATSALARTPLNASRVIRLAGVRADPALGAPDGMADFSPQAPQVLHTMHSVLRFRYDMLRELDAA